MSKCLNLNELNYFYNEWTIILYHDIEPRISQKKETKHKWINKRILFFSSKGNLTKRDKKIVTILMGGPETTIGVKDVIVCWQEIKKSIYFIYLYRISCITRIYLMLLNACFIVLRKFIFTFLNEYLKMDLPLFLANTFKL